MRIETTYRSLAAAPRGAISRSGASAGRFEATVASPIASRAPAAPPASLSGMEALLALQEADDPVRSRRRAVRRGQSMLDALEAMKADLLLGKVSEGRLNQLVLLIAQVREKSLPQIDSLIDDIELRVRVELAKFGRG